MGQQSGLPPKVTPLGAHQNFLPVECTAHGKERDRSCHVCLLIGGVRLAWERCEATVNVGTCRQIVRDFDGR